MNARAALGVDAPDPPTALWWWLEIFTPIRGQTGFSEWMDQSPEIAVPSVIKETEKAQKK